MTSGNNSWVNKFYTVIMPKIYGIGAAVVIAGAMFKLLNWSGGALMLGVGLTTEAIIFFLSSFEPTPKEVDWTKVYPELNEDYRGPSNFVRNHNQSVDSISEKLDEMFAKAKIDGALIEKLGGGMQHLAESVTHIGDFSNAVQATEKYTTSLEKASESLEEMYKANTSISSVMNKLDGLAENTQNFHSGIQELTETINRANINYSAALKEMHERIEGTKLMYANIGESMSQLQEASSETENFRLELSNLNEKLASLNNVYGNMLMALKS
jgi:gliding motility-associated protein GldL